MNHPDITAYRQHLESLKRELDAMIARIRCGLKDAEAIDALRRQKPRGDGYDRGYVDGWREGYQRGLGREKMF